MNNTNTIDQRNVCNTLMLSHVWGSLPTAQHHAWACSAGSKGYCATKEMLQNGTRGHTLLIESSDLRDMGESSDGCCIVFNFLKHNKVLDTYKDFFTLYNYKEFIPTTTKHVTIYSNCVSLPPQLLHHIAITSIDLSPVQLVEDANEGFLMGCKGLTELDLSPLSQISEVQNNFLADCEGLSTITLSPLSSVTEISGFFLKGCSGLTTLDLSPLSKLRYVGSFFLARCAGITALDLTPLSNVKKVERDFLAHCSGLTSLDLTPLAGVERVEEGFLHECTGLVELDLSPLSQVAAIIDPQYTPRDFLEGCWRIVVIDNPPPMVAQPPRGWVIQKGPTGTADQWVRPYRQRVDRGIRLGGEKVAGACAVQ